MWYLHGKRHNDCTPALIINVQALGQGQDRAPPRIATRKPSWDATKAPGPAAGTIDNPAQPLTAPSRSPTNTDNGTVRTSSKRGNVKPSGPAPLADHEAGDIINFSEDVGHAGHSTPLPESDQEQCRQNPPSSGRASAAPEDAVAHRDDVGPGSIQEEQEGQRPKRNHAENIADSSPRDNGVQRQTPQPSVESTANPTIQGETSANSSPSAADETQSVKAAAETATGVDVDVHHKHARELDLHLRIKDAPPDSEGSDNPNHSTSNKPNGGNPRTMLAPGRDLGTCADREGGRLQQAPEAAATVEGENIQAETHQKPQSEERPRAQEGAHLSHQDTGDAMSDSDNLTQDTKPGAGSRRRSSERRNNGGDRGVRVAGRGEMGGGGDPHALSIEGDPESEAEDAVDGGRLLPSSSVNQDLLQSPPMLSRRRTSGIVSEPLMGSKNAVRPCWHHV